MFVCLAAYGSHHLSDDLNIFHNRFYFHNSLVNRDYSSDAVPIVGRVRQHGGEHLGPIYTRTVLSDSMGPGISANRSRCTDWSLTH